MSEKNIIRTLSLQNQAEMEAFAGKIARQLKPGDCLGLSGPLGVGKTYFARSLIRALVGEKTLEVPSPTFTLVQTYETSTLEVWHCDLYRLKEENEVYELGLEDIFETGVCLIEWPDRLGSLKPQGFLLFEFSFGTHMQSETERKITIYSDRREWRKEV